MPSYEVHVELTRHVVEVHVGQAERVSELLPAKEIVPYLARGICMSFQMPQTTRAKEFVVCRLHGFTMLPCQT